MMKNYILHLFLLLTLPAIAQQPLYQNGMVVSAHPIASKVGTDVLKKGGNAVDAAVAVQFALSVVLPIAGNIGGGGFLVYRSADGQHDALDYREKAPGEATETMYLDKDGNPVTDLSLFGQLAAGVPGTVDGMVKAHEKYGKLSWEELIQPAIDLAEKGFPVTKAQAEEFAYSYSNFEKWNPEGTAFTVRKDWKKSDLLIQKELAETLKLIQKQGRKGFYEGKTAEFIVNEMKSGNGIISLEDLKNYESVWRTPVTGNYKNLKIISMPPPSSGGIALISLLHSVENYPLRKWGFQKDSTVQVMVEAERRVYADRAEHLGDPDFYKVPVNELIQKENSIHRMKDFSFDKATPSSEISANQLNPKEKEETTHYSIVDKDGNAVSVTTTLNGGFGSFVVVKGAGFILNNEMDDFSVKPGSPNMYGLVGGKANAIAPNKRMLSSMTPTILEKDGNLFMVVGTPGGSTIITSVFQTILNVVEFDMNMQEAVSAPRFHHQWLPDEVFIDKTAISGSERNVLTEKGYKLTERSPWGRVDGILIKENGSLEGGADPRGDDFVSGF